MPTFLANVGTIGEANSQLQKISTTVLSEDIAKLDIDSVVSKLADLNAHLDDHIRLRSKNWGIEVMEAGIVKINPSHDYAKAQRDAAMAPFLATARVTAAKAEATERVLFGEADGKASAARASGPLLGRAEGLAKIKEELGVTGSEVLGAETARDAMNNAEWGVLGASSGVADLLGLVKAGSEALKGPGNQPKK